MCPDNLGFTGVLKQRYTDFLVNEIGLDGQVLHLRSTEVEERKDARQSRQEANGANKEKVEEKLVVKEEKHDTDMLEAHNGANALPEETAKEGAAPEQLIIQTEHKTSQEGHAKEEPEEEVYSPMGTLPAEG